MKENYCVKEKQNKILGETTDKSEKKTIQNQSNKARNYVGTKV
jgi:hypothetical protein